MRSTFSRPSKTYIDETDFLRDFFQRFFSERLSRFQDFKIFKDFKISKISRFQDFKDFKDLEERVKFPCFQVKHDGLWPRVI